MRGWREGGGGRGVFQGRNSTTAGENIGMCGVDGDGSDVVCMSLKRVNLL